MSPIPAVLNEIDYLMPYMCASVSLCAHEYVTTHDRERVGGDVGIQVMPPYSGCVGITCRCAWRKIDG